MFWIKVGLIAIIVFVVISIIKLLLRKLLKIEKVKKRVFSYNHINELHQKIDKGLRIFSVTLILLSYVLLFYYLHIMYVFSTPPLEVIASMSQRVKCPLTPLLYLSKW
ncbi:DUF4181 domain-containing protein [Peribacillus loiseleuriae]|uniref:DUF4181 domain-containing protein n=1 Tax=Peribacillus loiseleuriae TaxID=1679170 RepID=UPI0037F54CD1